MFSSLKTKLLLQVLGQSTWAMTIQVIHDDEGMGDIPGIQGGFRGSVGSAQLRLDWHKNSDLRSEVGNGTGLNSTTLCWIESVALMTKAIGIVTLLIPSIIVVVAPRLISYRNKLWDHIIQEQVARSYRTRTQTRSILYMGFSGRKRREMEKEAVQCVCVGGEVQLKCNTQSVTLVSQSL